MFVISCWFIFILLHAMHTSCTVTVDIYVVEVVNVSVKLLSADIYYYKCKKLQFIHKLTASDTSKTAKIAKKVILPTSTSPKCQCAAE